MKLFGDYNNDKHHWKNIINDCNQFKIKMLSDCSISDKELTNIRGQIKDYRDKFIGHLDSDGVMHIPYLNSALKLVYFYYNEIIKELSVNKPQELPADIESYYEKCFNESKCYFDEANKR